MFNVRDGFLRAGHLPTLVAALLYFDVSFMVWVLIGPLAPFIAEDLNLSATQQGLIVAIPLLGGSLVRPLLGALGDRIGGRRAGLAGLVVTVMPLLVGWQLSSSFISLCAIGFALGIAGASFAVALPLASGWYPPKYQGLAMGIAGAGNSGSLIATLAAPRLAEWVGWQATFGLMALPVLLVLLLFALMARDSPSARPVRRWSDYTSVLGERDTLWFSVLYGLTFGGFVGFASFLTTFFNQQYSVSRVTAGDLTTVVVIAGSLLRPVGGWLSDRIGGYPLLLGLLAGASACLLVISALPSLHIVVMALFGALAMLGMGNGAVFQLVPQRFPERMGLVTGIVGAAGGLGGFMLPSLLGSMRDLTGTYGSGVLILAMLFAAGAAGLLMIGATWARSWQPDAARQAGIFSLRRTREEVKPAS
jgi:NNP family nitrate/nitrite transporter-like MFS transporter